MNKEKWIHCTNPQNFQEGKVFGWLSKKSPTGYWSGIVIKSDFLHLRVLVKDIRPGIITRKEN